MRLEFTLTPEDLADLRIILDRDKKLKSQKLKSTIFYLFCIGMAAVFFFIKQKNQQPMPESSTPIDPHTRTVNLTIFWTCLVLGILVLVWLFVIGPRRRLGGMLWDSLPGIQLPRTIELTDDEIIQSTSESKLVWKWDIFSGIDETDRLIQMRLGVSQSVLIPKHALSTDQLNSLRIMVQKHARPATI